MNNGIYIKWTTAKGDFYGQVFDTILVQRDTDWRGSPAVTAYLVLTPKDVVETVFPEQIRTLLDPSEYDKITTL